MRRPAHARTARAGARCRHRHRRHRPMGPMPSTSAAPILAPAPTPATRWPTLRGCAAHAHRYATPSIFVTLNTILRDDELEPARRWCGSVARGRRRRADRAGHGPAGAGPAADPAARQHADRHPHTREGALPAGRRASPDGPGARAHLQQIRAIAAEVRDVRRWSSSSTVRCAWPIQRPVLHQPCPHRPQRQPWQLLAGMPPALHRDRCGRPHRRPRQACAEPEGQRPERQPARAGRRRHSQLQDRGPLQGHGLREERDGPLPPAVRRASSMQRPRPASASPRAAAPTSLFTPRPGSRTSTAAPPTTSSTAERTTSAPSTAPSTPACPGPCRCCASAPDHFDVETDADDTQAMHNGDGLTWWDLQGELNGSADQCGEAAATLAVARRSGACGPTSPWPS